MADQFYIEEGYLEDDYFVYIAEAEISLSASFTISIAGDIADTTGYFIPDYIETGYFTTGVTQEASATLSSSTTTTLNPSKLHSSATVDIDSAFTPVLTVNVKRQGDIDLISNTTISATADRKRSIDVTLATIVNLSLQGDRFRDNSSSLTSNFVFDPTPERFRSSGVSLSSAFAIATTVGELELGASLQFGSFNFSSNGGYLLETNVNVDSQFNQTASPISYTITYPFYRPVEWDNVGDIAVSTEQSKYGSYSLKVNTSGRTVSKDNTGLAVPSSTEFVFEGWFYIDDDPIGGTSVTEKLIELDDLFWVGYTPSDAELVVRLVDSSGTLLFDSDFPNAPATSVYTNQWFHLAIKRDSNNEIGVWINNTNYQSQLNTTNSSAFGGTFQRLGVNNTDITNLYMDALKFNIGDSTISGYTSVPVNDIDYTRFLFNFENTLDDDLTFTIGFTKTLDSIASLDVITNYSVNFDAALDSAFGLSADVAEIEQGQADLNAVSSLDLVSTKIKPLESDLNAIFSQTSNLDRIRLGASALQSTFSQNAVISVRTDTDSTLASAFAQTATGVRIHPGEADLNALYAEIVVINKIGNTLVSIDTAFTQTTDPVKTTDTDATLDAVVSLSSDAVRTRPFDSALSSSFGITADLDRIRTSDIESYFETNSLYIEPGYFAGGIQVFVNMTATAGIVEQADATIASAFSITADVGEIEQGEIDLSTAITVSTAGDRVRFAEATLDGAFTPSITAVATKVGETTLDVEFTATTEGDRIRFSEASITGAFTPIVDVNAQLLGEINLATAFTIELEATQIFAIRVDETAVFDISIDAVKTAAGESTLNSVAEIDRFIGGAKFSASADISTAFTVEVDAKIIHVDQYVFDIHREYRTYTIPSEDRSFTIHAENRLASITSEDRLQDIYEEARTTTVEG